MIKGPSISSSRRQLGCRYVRPTDRARPKFDRNSNSNRTADLLIQTLLKLEVPFTLALLDQKKTVENQQFEHVRTSGGFKPLKNIRAKREDFFIVDFTSNARHGGASPYRGEYLRALLCRVPSWCRDAIVHSALLKPRSSVMPKKYQQPNQWFPSITNQQLWKDTLTRSWSWAYSSTCFSVWISMFWGSFSFFLSSSVHQNDSISPENSWCHWGLGSLGMEVSELKNSFHFGDKALMLMKRRCCNRNWKKTKIPTASDIALHWACHSFSNSNIRSWGSSKSASKNGHFNWHDDIGFLVGGVPTPLKNDGVKSQLGWWHSQLNGTWEGRNESQELGSKKGRKGWLS